MFFLIVDVLLAVCIITMILLHRGRGADVGVAFGGGSAGTVFGAKGATSFLGKLVGTLSAIFLINSLVLAYIANRDFVDQGIIEQIEQISAEDEAAASMETGEGNTPVYNENADTESAPEVPN